LAEGARRLGVEKKEKHHEHFISPPVTTYGRPKKTLAERSFRQAAIIANARPPAYRAPVDFGPTAGYQQTK